MDRVGVDLVHASSGVVRTSGGGGQSTVYVEADEEMATAAVTCGPHGGLQLTTITVAVPAPLSPSDPTAVLQAVAAAAAAAGPQHHHHPHQQHHHHAHQEPILRISLSDENFSDKFSFLIFGQMSFKNKEYKFILLLWTTVLEYV
jgi:hypothetical protein